VKSPVNPSIFSNRADDNRSLLFWIYWQNVQNFSVETYYESLNLENNIGHYGNVLCLGFLIREIELDVSRVYSEVIITYIHCKYSML
jgi:hypothetical protein